MYKLRHVIPALETYCRDRGETLEEREQRLGAGSAPIRTALKKAGNPVLPRNIRIILEELQIDDDTFLPYLEDKS